MTPEPRRLSLGRIFAGVLLVAIGVLWLVEEFTDVDIPWSSVLPALLILVGAALMFGAGTGRHGGLVTLGVILSVVVMLSSAIDVLVDVPFSGGVGDNEVTPITLESEYRWAIGSMTLDLTEVIALDEVATGDGRVDISVGIGELVVIVPLGVSVWVEADAGLGEVVVFDQTESGVSPEVTVGDDGADFHIIARVGMGRVEVRHP